MKLSQEDLFLQMLREAGDRGVHTFEMRKAYIGNPSERRARLEKRGHLLATGPKERLNGEAVGVRYFLVYDAETEGVRPHRDNALRPHSEEGRDRQVMGAGSDARATGATPINPGSVDASRRNTQPASPSPALFDLDPYRDTSPYQEAA